MTSSPDLGELPPALSSMWRLCKLGYRHEPRLMVVAFILSQLSALPDALLAIWFKLLGQGVIPTHVDPLIDLVPPAESERVMTAMRSQIARQIPALPTQAQFLGNIQRQAAR